MSSKVPAFRKYPDGTRVYSRWWEMNGTVTAALVNMVRVELDDPCGRIKWHTTDMLEQERTGNRQSEPPTPEGR